VTPTAEEHKAYLVYEMQRMKHPEQVRESPMPPPAMVALYPHLQPCGLPRAECSRSGCPEAKEGMTHFDVCALAEVGRRSRELVAQRLGRRRVSTTTSTRAYGAPSSRRPRAPTGAARKRRAGTRNSAVVC